MSLEFFKACLQRGRSDSRRVTRRELLKAGLATATGLLSGARTVLSGPHAQGSKRTVLIVGGGFSGLACAFELASAGYWVTVLEARKRVGGRVHSLGELIPGKNVEGGGEMLGSNHPHVLAYAAKFAFEFLNVSEKGADPTPMLLGGRMLHPYEIERISTEIEIAVTRMTDDARPVVADEPWKTPDARRLDLLSTAAWIEQLPISTLAKALLTVNLTGTNGVVPSRQSYLGNLAQVRGGGLEKYWTDTELFRLKGGNQQFALRFARELGADRVLLNCPAKEVDVTDNGASVLDAQGHRHVADDIVLAVPPSVWPAIKFSPALPSTLSPQMGMNVKFLAVVKERFWKNDSLSINATTDQDVTQTWEGTDGQMEPGPVAVTAFSGGPAAEANHQRAVAERQPAYLKALQELYPRFGEQFIKGQFMDWIGDPWSRASYSFPAPGQVTTIGPVLRAGLGRLHFAGEHTCHQFVGYMEGALNSGATVAKRIAARDGVSPR